MGQPKSQVTKDIISVAQDFAKKQECRQLYSHITDDNSRAYTALALYKGKYRKLIQDFPTLANDYSNNKLIRNQYSKYFGTALSNLAELAEESDPSFVRQATSTPAPLRSIRTAPTTAPAAVSSSSAEVSLMVQSINSLGKTFADRDAHTQEAILQMRTEQAKRDEKRAEEDAKRAEEDKENRDVMMKAINANTEMNKDTRNMAAYAIQEVTTAKKDIQTAKKEREAIRQFIGMDDDGPNVNLFQDGKYNHMILSFYFYTYYNSHFSSLSLFSYHIQTDDSFAADDLEVPIEENLEENIEVENDAATFDIEVENGTHNDDLEVPFEENLEVENATATFEIEEVEQPAPPSKNDVAGDLKVPAEENIEVENATATVEIEEVEQPGTASKTDDSSYSDSDSDDEYEHVPTKIPDWAQKSNLNPALERQVAVMNPDKIFGECLTCNLEQIFDKKKSRYQRRTSSGNWSKDHTTLTEKSDTHLAVVVAPTKDAPKKKTIFWNDAVSTIISVVIFVSIFSVSLPTPEDIEKLFSAYNLSVGA